MLLLLVEAALHSTLLGIAAWLGLKLLRIKDIQAEMMVWKIVLIAAIVMPLLLPWARVTIPGEPPLLSQNAGATATSAPDVDWSSPGLSSNTGEADDRSSPASPAAMPGKAAGAPAVGRRALVETVDWLSIATVLYLFVSGVLLLKLLIGLTTIFRFARTARPLEVEGFEGRRVCVSESIFAPATLASTVLLPPDFETWNAVKRRAVLSHELSHVARSDFFVLLLAMLYHVAFWFNPLSWWLLHRLRELMEMLSDDAAIADVGDAPTYAEVMLEVAANVRSTPMLIGMARAATVRRRIERILARTEPPPSPGRRKQILLAAAFLPLVAASAVTIASGSPKEPNVGVVAQAIVPAQPSQPVVDRWLLNSYPGNYERESSANSEPLVFTITRHGDRLLLVSTGMPAQMRHALFPKNDHTFTYSTVVGRPESELTFVPGSQGRATAIVMHENGEDFRATRVDEDEAKRAAELFEQRLASQRQPRVPISIDSALFDRFVGAYKMKSEQIVTMEREGDQFFLRYVVPGLQKFRIYPESETAYFAEEIHVQFTFVTDQQGQVTGLISHQGGWSHAARRIGEAEVQLAEAATAERARRIGEAEVQLAEAAAAERARRQIERRADEQRPREAIAVDPSVSRRDTGIYDAGFNGTFGPLFTITQEGDQLFAQMPGQSKLPIYPEREHEYFYKGFPAQLTFVMEGQGMATRLILHQSGRDITAHRINDWPEADRQPSAIDPEVLARYVGWYQLGPFQAIQGMVAAVTREGDHLFVRRAGQEQFEVFPSSSGAYFSSDNHAWVAVKAEGGERASEIILYGPQMGAQRGTRMDDTKGREIQDAVTHQNATAPDRFIAQQPAPGGETMVRKYIEMARSGIADDDFLSPRAADLIRWQGSFLRDQLTKLGPLQSLSFRGVIPAGFDLYDATFANGRAKITIEVGSDGKLDRANVVVENDGTPGAVVDCSQEGTLKPQEGTLKLQVGTSLPMMTIVNRSGGDINLFNLSASGDRYSASLGPLPPIADGRSMTRGTLATMPFVVTDAAGACLEIIMPGDSTRTVVIRPKGVLPRSAGRSAVPLPGAEDLLRQYIDEVRRGTPDYQQMTPWAADAARRTLRFQQAILATLGAVQTVTFAGIDPVEDDIYRVKFDNGIVEWRVDLSPDGKIRRIALGPQ
jgi:beta-lactamase regulating signal transducer with metallopeptidase domain